MTLIRNDGSTIVSLYNVCVYYVVFSLKFSLLLLNAFMEMPLLIMSSERSINLVTIFIHSVKSKTFGDRAFENMASKLWNNLPQSIGSITDFDQFKSMLRDPPFW